ncbi:DUF5333 domain-containing protein [Palleronia sp.]|uniref:DUF5333 domain-containing protein n=1 Tax=Palleronia sp. TaxID=1940284 RepID=UPI0035C7AEBE
MRPLIAAICLFAAGSQAASAQSLAEDPTVRQGFYAIGLADEIRKNCPSITPRLVRAYTFLKSLESYALQSGYSEEDVEELKDNDVARSQLEEQIRSDLAARGATPGNAAGYCQVGREEMARGTAAGRLLRGN